MLLITCPWCGPRDEIEFAPGGEAHRTRPADPSGLDDKAWADFLFMRSNPKGVHRERWSHAQGCRCWFNVERSTVTHEILRVYPPAPAQAEEPAGELPPVREALP